MEKIINRNVIVFKSEKQRENLRGSHGEVPIKSANRGYIKPLWACCDATYCKT